MQFANTVSLTVPSTVNINNALSADETMRRVENVAQMFSEKFGGATAQAANGYYVAVDGSLIKEDVTIVTAFVAADNDRLPYLQAFMQNIAQTFCDMWGQECVLYTVGPTGFLVFGRGEQK